MHPIQFEYNGAKGNFVDWLDVDANTLTNIAREFGFDTEVAYSEDDGNYLALLKKVESQ